ncbi:MAG: ribulose-phosphate 3-epimerase [Eubacterium sp.]|nr:ribulose-phosphate 3-epimerase [Eubacterium sp.]
MEIRMKKEFHLAPSILSADFGFLKEQLDTIKKCGAKAVHIDVMDGQFVPPISYGVPVIKSIRRHTDLIFDVHLMVEEPIRFVRDLREAGADLVTVHAEACRHLDRTLQAIHEAGMMAGVALNPATPLNVLDYVLDKTDMVLIMTVNPGYGGQKYLESMTAKIHALREKLDKAGYKDLPIEVDGGINAETIEAARNAGAEIFVAGSAVFKGSIEDNMKKIVSFLPEL